MEDFKDYLNLINNCDSTSPLLSQTPLGKRLDEIPLEVVDQSDLIDLTQALNVEQLVPTEDGLARDYRGLAEIMGFSSIQTEACFKRSMNPTKSLLDFYVNLSIARKDRKPSTLNDLLKMLEQLERFDVIDDFMKILIKLATSTHSTMNEYPRYQEELDSNNPRALMFEETNTKDRIGQQQLVEQKFDQLTVDDRPNSAIIYDAFICFAIQDIKYAQQLINFLESVGKRVATVDDILPGHFEHDALIRLIDERCRKVITVLTPNFLQSKECEFQTKFANEVGLKADCRKIIPVLFENCDYSKLPSSIKVLSKLDMTSQESYQWQLRRLVKSLGVTEETSVTRELPYSNYPNSSLTHNHHVSSPIDQVISYNRVIAHQPTITCVESSTSSRVRHNSGGREPIVDLLYSQNSAHSPPLVDCTRNQTMTRASTQSPDFERTLNRHSIGTVNKPTTKGWLQVFKKKVLGSSSSIDSFAATTSSQALLITSNSTEFLEDASQTDLNDNI